MGFGLDCHGGQAFQINLWSRNFSICWSHFPVRGFHCFLVWAEPEGLETGVGPRHPGSGGVGGGGLVW